MAILPLETSFRYACFFGTSIIWPMGIAYRIARLTSTEAFLFQLWKVGTWVGHWSVSLLKRSIVPSSVELQRRLARSSWRQHCSLRWHPRVVRSLRSSSYIFDYEWDNKYLITRRFTLSKSVNDANINWKSGFGFNEAPFNVPERSSFTSQPVMTRSWKTSDRGYVNLWTARDPCKGDALHSNILIITDICCN